MKTECLRISIQNIVKQLYPNLKKKKEYLLAPCSVVLLYFKNTVIFQKEWLKAVEGSVNQLKWTSG